MPDNDPLTVTAVLNAVNGTVSIVNGKAVFTPTAGFAGIARVRLHGRRRQGRPRHRPCDIDVRPDADPVKLQLAVGGPGNEIIVNERAGTVLTGATVAPLPDGGFVPSWLFFGNVAARVFDSDGQPLTGDFHVSLDNPTKHRAPHVVGMANGDFVVVWHTTLEVVNNIITNSDVFARRYNADGPRPVMGSG